MLPCLYRPTSAFFFTPAVLSILRQHQEEKGYHPVNDQPVSKSVTENPKICHVDLSGSANSSPAHLLDQFRPPLPGPGRFSRSIIVLSMSFLSTRLLRLITEVPPCWPFCPPDWPDRAGVDAPLELLCPVGDRPPGAEAA